VAERVIISGDAGTVWTNDTERVRYQFIAALNNTCGVCLQYHLKISASWPIPIHHNCRCIQRMIKPGQKAPHPFCDYRELLDQMSPADQAAAVGASCYRLLKAGVIKWEDVVTPNRVRDFREVVARKRLTVDQMVRHGVKRYQAEKAYSAVHTEEHQHVQRQRAELLQRLTAAGISQENLVGELSRRLAGRVTVAAGPTPAQVGRPQDGFAPAWSGGKLPGVGPSGPGELAKLISGWRPGKAIASNEYKAGPLPPKEPSEQAIARATRVAEQNGVSVAPLDQSESLLWETYGDNPLRLKEVIAHYDEHRDEILINQNHEAWSDARAYIQDNARTGRFSSRHADHVIRHEIGHAQHYRRLSESDRADIWYKELSAEQATIASQVSKYATEGKIEFVAEVYAGKWAGRRFSPAVMKLYRELKGPPR
jgi:hypothetical protein